MTTTDVYLLALHDPDTGRGHSPAGNALVVHADTLRHPRLPQPDGAMIFRCLTEFPAQTSGEIIPLSTLTHELDGGRLWPQVADWERVVAALVTITCDRGCDAIPLDLPPITAALLANGPNSRLGVPRPGGSPLWLGPAERGAELQKLTDRARELLAGEPLWPGRNLVAPPTAPARMPYRPRPPSPTA